MGSVSRLSDYRPPQEAVEHRVAELEDGYTRLSNQLLAEYAGADLTKRQFKVLLAVVRLTYGWNKPMDRISDQQIADIARLPVKKCNEAKLELVRMNILIKNGTLLGPNKNISEWNIPQSGGESPKTGENLSPKMGVGNPPKRGDTKDIIPNTVKTITQTHDVGFSVEEKLTPRQKGTNPRAEGTNPRSAMPAFDRERLKGTWNLKAEKLGLPKIRSISTTVENGLKRLWQSYLKQCRELGNEPNDIDTFLNGYLAHGYTPTKWACGDNPDGRKYGIETALRQEKIDEILSRED